MEKRYFLLKDYDTGEPREVLCFHGDITKAEIQNAIWVATSYFCEHEDEIMNDPKLVYIHCQYDYVIECLYDEFDFEVLDWDNEDNLYY